MRFAPLLLALLMTSCASTFKETYDPSTGVLTSRESKIAGNVNVLTSGNLANSDGSGSSGGLVSDLFGGLLGGGGGRQTLVTSTAANQFADPSRPTLKFGELEFYGTLDHSTPTAAVGRSATGILAEARKWAVRIAGIDALRDVELSGDRKDVDIRQIEADEAVAIDTNATGVAIEQINSETALGLEELSQPAP